MLISWDCDEPLTLVEAKAHLRVDFAEDDALISALVVAAREQAENYICAPIRCRTETIQTQGFPASYRIPGLNAVNSIGYGAETFTDYTVLNDVVSGCFPTTDEVVTIEYSAGYPTEAEVPQAIKQALLLTVGHLYENREAVVLGVAANEVPMTTMALLHPYREYAD